MSTSDETDFYKILGVQKDASQDDIKKAHRKFAFKWHPDRQHGKTEAEKKEAEEMFKRGAAAYECLSDPEKRKVYDQFGIDGLKGHAQQGDFSGGMPGGLGDFLRSHFGFNFGFGGMGDSDFGFNSFGRRGPQKQEPPSNNEPENGRSFRLRMSIDLEDVIFGKEKEFSINGLVVCPECHGHKCDEYEECPQCHGMGMSQRIQGNTIFQTSCQQCQGTGYIPKNLCKRCSGEGRVQEKQTFTIKIPKGMPEGGQLRLRGKGECGLNGGSNGDVFIVVETNKHPLFKRSESNQLDLEMNYYINPLIGFVGGKVSIPTPHEMVSKELAAGVKNGQQIRLGGYGIRTDGLDGDLLVNLIYDTPNPSSLTNDEREAIKVAYEKTKNKSFVNGSKLSNDLNTKTKLPWIIQL